MAQQIPFSIIEKIIVQLASVSFQQIVSIYNADDDLKKLQETVSTIKAVLLDAEKRQEESEAVQNWIKRLKRVLNQADDLLDDVLTQALKLKADNPGKVRKFLSSSNRIFFRREMASRIKGIRVKLGDIAKDMSEFRFTRTVTTQSKHRETHSFVLESEIIGREESRDEIKKLLLHPSNTNENNSLVAIVGIGGLGKTTVAQLVYSDVEVANLFGKRLWVCVSDDFDVRLIAQRILECFTNQDVGNLALNELGIQLRAHMTGVRYLLVLDDVWNESYEKWNKLRNFLVFGAKGSKILVTSRSKTVANTMGIEFPYYLGILNEQQSRSLFRKIAFQDSEHSLIGEKEKIGDKIADKCKGLPLAITTMAGMLRSKSEVGEWLSILNDEIWRLPQRDEDIMPVLRLSYNHLPMELKQCFAYCSLYEKDKIISKVDLIQLWMAQGYLNLENENKCLEDVGEEYVLSLLRRSFFQNIVKDEVGEIATFKMHDLIHDLALSIAGSDCSIYQKTKLVDAETLHLSCVSDDICPDDFLHAKGMRTFLVESTMADQFNSIHTVRSLRALTLSRPYRYDRRGLLLTEIPKSIGRLTHLRYLHLFNQPALRSLPNSISNLVNLQTLKLNDCRALEELPQGITKLVNLRCLTIEGCGKLCMPSGIALLTSLTSLTRFIVGIGSNSLKLHELKGLNNLRGDLWVQNLILVPNKIIASQSIEANLKEKKCLVSLTIDWNRHEDFQYLSTVCVKNHKTNVDLQLEVLENLQPHKGLKGLRISCYPGTRLASWLCSLTNLMSLDLKCLKHCKQIPPLNGLPLLQKISLEAAEALEYICYDIGSTTMFFPSLTSLLLIGCPSLKEWSLMQQQTLEQVGIKCENKKEKHMLPPPFPRLSELKIWEAPMLINMPPFPHLQEGLDLVNCSLKPLMETIKSLTETSSGDNAAIPVRLEVQSSPLSSLSLPHAPLSKLKSLTLKGIQDAEFQLFKDWMQNLNSLEHLYVDGCDMLVSVSTQCQHLTTLKSLKISGVDKDMEIQWEGLFSLHSLQSLQILFCQTLTGLPECFSDLRALQHLSISSCPNFVSLPESVGRLSNLQSLRISHVKSMGTVMHHIGNLTSLLDLAIDDSSDLESLPDGILNLVNLQKITIQRIENLKILPEWIGGLTSLRQLSLWSCLKLASLPEGMRHLTNLQKLSITECPILTERCRRDTGQDWPKIAHIPDLQLEIEPFSVAYPIISEISYRRKLFIPSPWCAVDWESRSVHCKESELANRSTDLNRG